MSGKQHGRLVIVRHGESLLNLQNRFTGWLDVSLSGKGIREAQEVARHCEHYNYDAAFTSDLERAHETLLIILSKQRRLGHFTHGGAPRYNHLTNAPSDFL